MDIYEKAINYTDFGLRQSFTWSNDTTDLSKIRTDICWSERSYITRLLRPVFTGALTIKRIENPYLWGGYVLQYEEMKANCSSAHVREQIMIHGTSLPNANCIAEENFDWRLVNRSRFGKGVSFTSNAEYAKSHATMSNVYIVAGVLVANSSRGSWHQIIPENGEDTTTGYTKETCIKYYDNDFYPYYIVQQ